MKKYPSIVLFLLFTSLSIFSQDKCNRNILIAKKYLEKRKDIKPRLFKEIENSIETCYSDNGLSYYIKGLIKLRKKPSPNYSDAFKHFEKASQLDYTRAKTYLGYFYKNGLGVQIDYKKSLYWIEQAAEENDNNALYTLGYYYLKGLADLEPNYEKAIYYFEKSNLPMAKHWLAFCKYFGFGVEKNEFIAENMLESNETPNSEELLSYLEEMQKNNTSDFEEFISNKKPSPANTINGDKDKKSYGLWIEKDWKNEKIIRTLPIVITKDNSKSFNIEIEEKSYLFTLDNKGKLLSKNLSIRLSSPFSSKNRPEINSYNIKSINISEDNESGITDVECHTWIEEYKEKGSPLTLRIFNEKAIAKRIDKTFKVYPVPFQDFLNFSFVIEHESLITFSLFDLGGNLSRTFDFWKKEIGKHDLKINSDDIKKGSYIAVMYVNGLRLARQVVKVN